MKRHSGCLSRILMLLICLGILAAVLLGYMGYEKAEKAETTATPVDQLHEVYAGSFSGTLTDTDLPEAILNSVAGDHEVLKKLRAGLSDDTVAKMIVEIHYLPDDGLISTAIGQRILIHRLKQTYTEEELLQIYCGLRGYNLSNLGDMKNALQNSEIKDPETLLDKATPILMNLIDDLKDQGVLSEEKAKELENLLN